MSTTTQPYQRRKGLFGSMKSLTVTALEGTESVLSNAVEATVNTTDIAVTITGSANSITKVWAGTLQRTVESQAKVTDIELQIEEAHIDAELKELQKELAKVKRSPGRPAKVAKDA